MQIKKILLASTLSLFIFQISAQSIGDFISVEPVAQTDQLVLPSTHSFQRISETGDALTAGGTLPATPDFTAYVPIAGSSTNGYISLNHESPVGAGPGAVTIFDINFNGTTNFWEITASEGLDFSAVGPTYGNCSGTVTSWGTVISSEEVSIPLDISPPFNGYYDAGWNVEIDPATKTVLGKRWAMGNMAHENVTIHSNDRTVYQGADSNPGYLYKFVATNAQDLSDGLLYVYTGSKAGAGTWVLLDNTTVSERNTTLSQSASAGATVFNGIEDVEIGPDGMVYLAVKGSGDERVYRFQDSDPLTGTTATMETFVGGMSYDITHSGGTVSTAWGAGNDNLAFDGDGNLWVFQDGGNNYIWVVGSDHTQGSPNVRVFAIMPTDGEPTGITFTPDFKFLFMSIQAPNVANNANQDDAQGTTLAFNKGTSIVISLAGNFGGLSVNEYDLYPNKTYLYPNPSDSFDELVVKGENINSVKIYSVLGKLLREINYNNESDVVFERDNLPAGIYFLHVNDSESIKLIFK
ncbi:MAG: DUF839 domain-containing protein [Urechidicola sp.]|nr:DUF839 domain-containing protein [Urechidicola sp.]